jgi:hypothetical protein
MINVNVATLLGGQSLARGEGVVLVVERGVLDAVCKNNYNCSCFVKFKLIL